MAVFVFMRQKNAERNTDGSYEEIAFLYTRDKIQVEENVYNNGISILVTCSSSGTSGPV